jgi:hypothetical protein
MKIRIVNYFEKGSWQLSTPYIALFYAGEKTVCFAVSLVFFEIAFWFGYVKDIA